MRRVSNCFCTTKGVVLAAYSLLSTFPLKLEGRIVAKELLSETKPEVKDYNSNLVSLGTEKPSN